MFLLSWMEVVFDFTANHTKTPTILPKIIKIFFTKMLFLPDGDRIPYLQRESVPNQNNFREIKDFSSESEIIQNKFSISLIQRKNSESTFSEKL